MLLRRTITSIILIVIGLIVLLTKGVYPLLYYTGLLIVLETFCYFLTQYLRKKFPWLITPDDEHPEIDPKGLDKFMEYGFDPELGWIRKPNTSKKEIGKDGITEYHIDKTGARTNPEHENLPKIISC